MVCACRSSFALALVSFPRCHICRGRRPLSAAVMTPVTDVTQVTRMTQVTQVTQVTQRALLATADQVYSEALACLDVLLPALGTGRSKPNRVATVPPVTPVSDKPVVRWHLLTNSE